MPSLDFIALLELAFKLRVAGQKSLSISRLKIGGTSVQLPLEPMSVVPLYRQIADGIKDLIDKGGLSSSTRLPSTRQLAEQLGVSRCTASLAYEELTRYGYIVSPSHAGTFVANGKSVMNASAPLLIDESIRYERLSTAGSRLMMPDICEELDAELFPQLNSFAPSIERLPNARWFLMMSQARQRLTETKYVSDVFGSPRLRKTLVSLLERTKGIAAHEDQICVFSSAQLALDLFARLLIDPGDSVLVENPGFPGIRRTAAIYGGVLQPIAVDHGGIVTADLWSTSGKVLYVSPEHQMPTGVTLAESRRFELLYWAHQLNALVIEDDFDAEYNYAGQTSAALKSLDSRCRVIYLSSFWTTLFPLCKLAFAVVPPYLVSALKKAKGLVDRHANAVEQDTLSSFIQDGSYERHLKKTRLDYVRNREALITTLNRLFGHGVIIASGSSGTTLSIRFNKADPLLSGLDKDELARLIQAFELPMVSTVPFYLDGTSPDEYLISFTGSIDELTKKLALLKLRLKG